MGGVGGVNMFSLSSSLRMSKALKIVIPALMQSCKTTWRPLFSVRCLLITKSLKGNFTPQRVYLKSNFIHMGLWKCYSFSPVLPSLQEFEDQKCNILRCGPPCLTMWAQTKL